jgi:hypothetical protein
MVTLRIATNRKRSRTSVILRPGLAEGSPIQQHRVTEVMSARSFRPACATDVSTGRKLTGSLQRSSEFWRTRNQRHEFGYR